jgi:hypothetical protein
VSFCSRLFRERHSVKMFRAELTGSEPSGGRSLDSLPVAADDSVESKPIIDAMAGAVTENKREIQRKGGRDVVVQRKDVASVIAL